MKAAIAVIFIMISTTAYSSPLQFKTLHLISWASQCSLRIAPTYEMQGMASNLAMQSAIQLCSCVIDHYRENHKYNDLQKMPLMRRESFGELYSKECLHNPERET